MYDTFMLITGIIFILMTIVTAFLFVVANLVYREAAEQFKNANAVLVKYTKLSDDYENAIERSNELEVENFRLKLDCNLKPF